MLSLSFLKRTEGTSIIKYVTFEQFDIVIILLTVDEADSEALKTLFDKTKASKLQFYLFLAVQNSSIVVVITFSKADAERLRLIKREFRLTPD